MKRVAFAVSLALSLGLPTTALAAEPPDDTAASRAQGPMLELSLAPLYGFGGARHGFGGQAGLGMFSPLWQGEGSTGSLELGLLLGYDHESYGRSDRFLGEGQVDGGTHRIEALLLAGPGLRLAAMPRVRSSLQLYGGWVQAFMHAQLDNELQSISGDYEVSVGVFSTGLALTHRLELAQRVGLDLQVRAPFPMVPAAITSYVFASLGVSVGL